MCLKRKKQTNSHLIERNMILKLIWNQTRCQNLNHCTACHKKNCKCYMNILMNSLQKNSFDQVISHSSHLCCLSRNQKKNYVSILTIKHWMWSQFEINIWFFWFKKHWIDFWKHDTSWSLTSFMHLIKFIYVKMMRSILHSEQDENCLNNLWCLLIWRMNSVCFSIILMTCYMNFLMYLSWYISMISWSTQTSYLNIKDTYNWYSNNCEKQIYNVTFENVSFMQVKWCILTWLCLEKKSRWIQLKLK